VTTILLARHGETDWNRDGRWQGHSDTSLNERGRAQAHQLADELAEQVDAVYSSDLARARETAEIVARRLGIEVQFDARLRERGFGSWEGLTHPEVEERDGEALARWRDGKGHGAADAEPYDVFARRMERFLEDILERHPGERVLVISHGGSIRVVHALARGLDYVRDHGSIPAVPNCAVARYVARNGRLAPQD
jgi:broad specificity phosphatase PhoE